MSPVEVVPFTPMQRYQCDLARPDFVADPAQRVALGELQDLYERLLAARAPKGVVARLRKLLAPRPAAQKGLYLWGGVGRGKTYLMDTFYESLPFPDKCRTHFHRFMRDVHRQLQRLGGVKNPLERVAEDIARDARVICFDEFFVSDIGDAMILANLLDALFRRGVTLVATSNIEPAGLYCNGLQRARFLPAIDLLNRHTRVVNVDGGVDHRLRALEKAELYHSPLDPEAEASLMRSFHGLMVGGGAVHEAAVLEIEGRNINTVREADGVVWFEFAQLCDGPRSQNDYIELAREYHSVLLAGVPRLTGLMDSQARRFINLVDEFYDRSVKLVISAEVPVEELYAGRHLGFEFQRTISRLLEMQSREYLARPHRSD
ncbi:cell division protein ZapE [Microbulbifer sp. TYP-18]|uniref:cell division protein ZapE n=1 Tax=Microbulbifer sp. TYP-18 TaxID=3230024 RepID=UPI0034C66628